MNHYRAQSLDRRMYGVCVGLVEDNEDDGHEARVKVRFPWLDDRTVSEWCRVCQPYAGNGYGVVMIPEAGDEVLVGFIHGEMAEPVVLGGLYNGTDKPPTHKDHAQKDQKLIRTKGEHQLLFDDGSSSKKIQLTTAGGHTLTLDDQEQTITAVSSGGHTLTASDRDRKIAIASTGGIEVTLDDTAQKLSLTVGGSTITLDATGNISIKGSVITISGQSLSLNG